MCSKKNIYVKAFNIITNKNEAKSMTEHISSYSKCKFISATYNLKQKRNNKTCQCECKNYRNCKKITLEILAHVSVRIAIT